MLKAILLLSCILSIHTVNKIAYIAQRKNLVSTYFQLIYGRNNTCFFQMKSCNVTTATAVRSCGSGENSHSKVTVNK